jgi:hypothetical protein
LQCGRSSRSRTSVASTPRLHAETSRKIYKSGKTIRKVAREKSDLFEEELDELLDARKMTDARGPMKQALKEALTENLHELRQLLHEVFDVLEGRT